MDINNASSASTATSLGALINNTQQQQPATKNEKQPQDQNSVVVKLSEQAQQMNRAENQKNTEQAETNTKETAEPQGIQFMEGESKSGRVNTYA